MVPPGRRLSARSYGRPLRAWQERERLLWLNLPVLIGLLMLAASLWAFAVLSEDVSTGDQIVSLDVRLANWLHEHARPPLTRLILVITTLGSSLVLIPLAATAALWLYRRRRAAEAAFVVLALGGALALNGILKSVFERERPSFADPLAEASWFSFPSGHASASIAVYGALALLGARALRSWRARGACLGTAAALVVLIGFSRLYLGVHYLSDVLAGFSLGLVWLAVCTLFVILLRRERPGRSL